MTKRALKRTVREGAFDNAQFQDDGGKVRRLPVGNGWSPLGREEDREQGYLKTIKPKSEWKSRVSTLRPLTLSLITTRCTLSVPVVY